MNFAEMVGAAGIETATLRREVNVDEATLALWLSNAASPPQHVIRALAFLANLSGGQKCKMGVANMPVSERSDHRPKLVSLFSGTGGMDIGLENAGFETVLANEIEPHACQSLRANRQLAKMSITEFDRWFESSVVAQRCYRKSAPLELSALKQRIAPALHVNHSPLIAAEIVERDVRALDGDEVLQTTGTKLGELDLIAGGAPCQPFSRAGKQETVNCDDGRLFLEFVRLVDQTRPRWFLFENVKGLVQHRTDVLFSKCSHCGTTGLGSFGLRSSAHDFDTAIDTCMKCGKAGVAALSWEKRRGGSLDTIEAEFSRLGYSCQSAVLNARDYGVPQDRERLFIVGSRDGERFEWPHPTHSAKTAIPNLFNRAGLQPHRSFRDAVLNDGHWRYGELEERAVLWVKNVVRPHDEPVTWSLDRVAPTIGAHQAAKLALAPFGVPEAQLARQQWHTLGRRQGDSPPVFVEHEYLTDLELLKLQTFPTHWYLHGTRMERAFQIGNAVPPLLAEVVGRAILAAMSGTDMKSPRQAASQ